MARILIAAAALVLLGCSTTYRTGGDYRRAGDGQFKVGSDYGGPTASVPVAPPPQNYQPRNDFRLYWPVGQVKINRGFHTPSDPKHQGVDLGGRKDTPILAAHEGVVIYTGRHFHGYGNMVLVEYDKEWATLYAHMNKITAKEGQVVLPGDQIGRMGRTGHASGVHLHFELMHNRQPIDPMPYLSHSTNRVASRSR